MNCPVDLLAQPASPQEPAYLASIYCFRTQQSGQCHCKICKVTLHVVSESLHACALNIFDLDFACSKGLSTMEFWN